MQLFQWGILLFCLSILLFVIFNVKENLIKKEMVSGFNFLNQEASFEISESLISYLPSDTWLRALGVGFLNTLKVALLGNVISLFIGLILGMASLSHNFLLSLLARAYLEIFRNIPLLLQLFFWYFVITNYLPSVKEAYEIIPNVFISNRGLNIPTFNVETFSWNFPVLQGFNFVNGYTFTPEFLTLLVGLILYTSAFMSEIFRSGIIAIEKGQWEAARSLGLSRGHIFFAIILPQSMKIIIPPLISQILNLTKNSSLAVAIGYPDFVYIANTSINQTGQAIELILLILAVYLFFSLLSSLALNWYQHRILHWNRL